MDERASTTPRDLLEQLLLAGLGAVALTAERADRLADSLAEVGGVRREDAREAIEQLGARWRGDTVRLTERASKGLTGLFQELGLVTREEFDELELRVAQLEHRVRLLETPREPTRPVSVRRRA